MHIETIRLPLGLRVTTCRGPKWCNNRDRIAMQRAMRLLDLKESQGNT